MPTEPVIPTSFCAADARLVAWSDLADRLISRHSGMRSGLMALEYQPTQASAELAGRESMQRRHRDMEPPPPGPWPAHYTNPSDPFPGAEGQRDWRGQDNSGRSWVDPRDVMAQGARAALEAGVPPEQRTEVLAKLRDQAAALADVARDPFEEERQEVARLHRLLEGERVAFKEISETTGRTRHIHAMCSRWWAANRSAPPEFFVQRDPALAELSIYELRAMLPVLQRERQQIDGLPKFSLDEAQELAREAVYKAAAASDDEYDVSLAPFLNDDEFRVPVLVPNALLPPVRDVRHYYLKRDAEDRPEETLARINRKLAAYYATLPNGGLSHAERGARLGEIEARMRSVELAEELTIRRASDDLDAQPARRHDVRAEFVLGEW